MMRRSDLLSLVYRFYPAGMPVDHPEYPQTQEYRRQFEARRIAVSGSRKWNGMLGRLGAQDDSLHLTMGDREDPGYSGSIKGDRCALGCHVSFLGPYYGIHRLGAANEVPMAETVAQEIEKTYGGFQSIPPEISYGVVPHVELDTIQMDEATLYECLFSPDWDVSSRDGDDPAPENVRDTGKLRRPPTSIMLTRMTKSKRQTVIDHLMSLDLPDPAGSRR
jgi:hypothetical protein